MTMQEAKEIINSENLKLCNLDKNQPLREEQVVLRSEEGEWLVFATDERASIVTGSIFKYKTETEALEKFISRVRAANYILKNTYK